MLPQVSAIPGIGRTVDQPVRITEDIVLRVYGPSAAILFPCHLLPRASVLQSFGRHVGDERGIAFRKIGHFGRPIIHLHVDIAMVVALPCRIVHVVPQPLQVTGQLASARRAEHEVTPILEIEHVEVSIVFMLTHEHVCRVVRLLRIQVQLHTGKERLVIRQMRCFQLLVRLPRSLVHPSRYPSVYLVRISTRVRRRSEVEISRTGQHDRHRIRPFHLQPVGFRLHHAAVGLQESLCLVGQQIQRAFDGHRMAVHPGHPLPSVLHPQGEVQFAFMSGRRQAHHNHAVRVAGKIFAQVVHSVNRIRHTPYGIV